jgi:hypothetical protein
MNSMIELTETVSAEILNQFIQWCQSKSENTNHVWTPNKEEYGTLDLKYNGNLYSALLQFNEYSKVNNLFSQKSFFEYAFYNQWYSMDNWYIKKFQDDELAENEVPNMYESYDELFYLVINLICGSELLIKQ